MIDRYENLDLKLGRAATDAALDPIPRALSRHGRQAPASMDGYDLWNAYEVGYLTPTGKPAAWHMRAVYGANSPNMVESKSFKLYLNALNNEVFASRNAFADRVAADLAACIGAPVALSFLGPDESPSRRSLPGVSLDSLEPTHPASSPSSRVLKTADDARPFAFHSHLLRTNCPVTNQPDWGAILIEGHGPSAPQPETLLTYLLSFRNHQDFHEACCERIFSDLHRLLNPNALTVACFYTRRGGLDINPMRTTSLERTPCFDAVWRQ